MLSASDVKVGALFETVAGAGALMRDEAGIETMISTSDVKAGVHRSGRNTVIGRTTTSSLSFEFHSKVSAKIPPEKKANRVESELLRRAAAIRYDIFLHNA